MSDGLGTGGIGYSLIVCENTEMSSSISVSALYEWASVIGEGGGLVGSVAMG